MSGRTYYKAVKNGYKFLESLLKEMKENQGKHLDPKSIEALEQLKNGIVEEARQEGFNSEAVENWIDLLYENPTEKIFELMELSKQLQNLDINSVQQFFSGMDSTAQTKLFVIKSGFLEKYGQIISSESFSEVLSNSFSSFKELIKSFFSSESSSIEGTAEEAVSAKLVKAETTAASIGSESTGVVAAEMVNVAASSAATYAIYQGLKKFLSLEGKRRRGEIGLPAMLWEVTKTAIFSLPKGIAIGVLFYVLITVFEMWIMVPLVILMPCLFYKMAEDLWLSFWKGLDKQQQQELIEKANKLGGGIGKFFNNLASKTA